MVGTVSDVTATNGMKPVPSNAEQGIRRVTKKNQLVRSHATAGQCQVLRVPVDGEQQGQVEALEQQRKLEQGQVKAPSMSKSKS